VVREAYFWQAQGHCSGGIFFRMPHGMFAKRGVEMVVRRHHASHSEGNECISKKILKRSEAFG
jgi:hypothetical protein